MTVRSRFRLASFTFVLAKTGIKYVCFTQKRVDYNMLVIVIDKYIDQNNPSLASGTTVSGGGVVFTLYFFGLP